VGPGTGYYTCELAEWVGAEGRVDIFDIQQEFLDHAADRAAGRRLANVHPTQGDAQELPFEEGTFDACVLRKTEGGFEILGRPEGIERLARLIDYCAGALISSWPHMSQAEAAAEAGDLRREPGIVHIPLWEEHMPRGQEGEPEFFERRAEYDERRAAYTKVAAIIVEGLQNTEEHLEEVADELEENWGLNLYLAVGDFVNSETKILAQRYEQRGGDARRLHGHGQHQPDRDPEVAGPAQDTVQRSFGRAGDDHAHVAGDGEQAREDQRQSDHDQQDGCQHGHPEDRL
jgi:hypothetical protein